MEWKETSTQIAAQATQLSQIRPEDVPDIALYMDQLVTFLDQRLGELKRGDDAPFVTNTMVNNYTKAGLIPPAEHKRYCRRHVLGLSLVGQLKKVLSMQDLSRITTTVRNSVSAEQKLYEIFLESQREAVAGLAPLAEQCALRCEQAGLDGNEALAAMAVQLAVEAQCRTLLAERLLDAIQPNPGEEKKKKEKDK
ncbi:MAG: DUF1836 domain-containing protein [Angelakisella sp.]